jgi:hypothetical protein
VALDIVALMDALKIRRRSSPVRLGRAHGLHHRGAVARALQGLVSVSGYLINNREAARRRCRRRPSATGGTSSTSRPSAAGRLREEPARLRQADLEDGLAEVGFDDATFDRSAASFDNPDHVAS